MSPRLRRTAETELDLDALRSEVSEWYALKREAAVVKEELDQRTKRIKTALQKYGEVEPEKGHIILDLGEPVGEARISQLRNQKRDTQVMNEGTVEEILTDKGMWDEMTELIRVPDESRIRAAYYDNRISEDELAQMFPVTTTYALFALDDFGKPVRV